MNQQPYSKRERARALWMRAVALAALSFATHCASASPNDPMSEEEQEGEPSTGMRSDSGTGTKLDARVRTTNDAASPSRDAASSRSDAAGAQGGPVILDKYVKLDIAPTTPFDPSGGDAHPAAGFTPPMGWKWYDIEGAKCRDGSPFGVFVHRGDDPSKLFIYFEGGGACANPGFCTLNQDNVSEQFLTGGESAVASLFILPVPQAPNGAGVFDLQNPANPFHGWNMVFIPYCTGDVYAGTRSNVTVEGVATPQSFYGFENTRKVIGRLAATFKDLRRFVAGGSSAGGYGAGINFGYLQDTFRGALGSALLDASPPFTNDYVPTCLQKRWRDTWGVDGAYPKDCGEQCRNAEGGNLFHIVDYWREKYPSANVALISGVHDEIIRLFFSLGNDDCVHYQAEPPVLFIGSAGQTYAPDKFKAGLDQLRTKYAPTNQLATYYMAGFPNATAHQCLFRNRLYEKAAGPSAPTIAEFLQRWINGEMTQVGP